MVYWGSVKFLLSSVKLRIVGLKTNGCSMSASVIIFRKYYKKKMYIEILREIRDLGSIGYKYGSMQPDTRNDVRHTANGF